MYKISFDKKVVSVYWHRFDAEVPGFMIIKSDDGRIVYVKMDRFDLISFPEYDMLETAKKEEVKAKK
jgi:hypothetical protein